MADDATHTTATPTYLSQVDIGVLVGRPDAYVRQMRQRGKLPPPDAVIGTRNPTPGWLPATVDRLIRQNPQLLTDTATWRDRPVADVSAAR